MPSIIITITTSLFVISYIFKLNINDKEDMGKLFLIFLVLVFAFSFMIGVGRKNGIKEGRWEVNEEYLKSTYGENYIEDIINRSSF